MCHCNSLEWVSPCFIKPKKNITIQFLTYFRELNKRNKSNPYTIPNTQDVLLKLEGFLFAPSLDLNMVYYHIQLTPNSITTSN